MVDRIVPGKPDEKLLAQLLQAWALALLCAGLAVLVEALVPVLFLPVQLGHGLRGCRAVLRVAGGVAGALVGIAGVEGGRLRGGGHPQGADPRFCATPGSDTA